MTNYNEDCRGKTYFQMQDEIQRLECESKRACCDNNTMCNSTTPTSYFRITAYYPQDNFCFIVDSNGMFEKMWQFSSYLLQKGIKVIEISNDEKFLDGNITKAEQDNEHILLRASADGKPENIPYEIDGTTYKAIQVGDKIYIPDKEQTI